MCTLLNKQGVINGGALSLVSITRCLPGRAIFKERGAQKITRSRRGAEKGKEITELETLSVITSERSNDRPFETDRTVSRDHARRLQQRDARSRSNGPRTDDDDRSGICLTSRKLRFTVRAPGNGGYRSAIGWISVGGTGTGVCIFRGGSTRRIHDGTLSNVERNENHLVLDSGRQSIITTAPLRYRRLYRRLPPGEQRRKEESVRENTCR